MSITPVPISIRLVLTPIAARSAKGEESWRAKWWTRTNAPSMPSSSAATASSTVWRSASPPVCVSPPPGCQAPNERKPIFLTWEGAVDISRPSTWLLTQVFHPRAVAAGRRIPGRRPAARGSRARRLRQRRLLEHGGAERLHRLLELGGDRLRCEPADDAHGVLADVHEPMRHELGNHGQVAGADGAALLAELDLGGALHDVEDLLRAVGVARQPLARRHLEVDDGAGAGATQAVDREREAQP